MSNQPLYNMLTRAIEAEVIPVSEREGIGQIVFSPLAQGVLTGKYKPGQQPEQGTRAANDQLNEFMKGTSLMSDKTLTAVQNLQALARQNSFTLSQLALAWVLRQPNVSSAIIGASHPDQVAENVKAGEMQLSAEMLSKIDAILGNVVSYIR